MKKYRILSHCILFISCFLQMLTEANGQNPLLRELAKEDQASRSGKESARTDDERIRVVMALIAKGTLRSPEDRFNAALILQHTGLTFCDKRPVGRSPDNYLLAHHLFKSAWEGGYKDARYLVAASIDRYLSFTEGQQKYGTNRIVNRENGKEELVPIDRRTTDTERAKYGVPPLSEILKQYPEHAKKPQ